MRRPSASAPSSTPVWRRALAAYRLIACAAPSYLQRHGAPNVPEDLAAHEYLGYVYWSRPADGEWTFTRCGETHRVRSRLQANDSFALLAAALDGYGVALGGEDLFRESLAAGRLARVLPAFEGPSRPLRLLFARDRRQTPILKAIIEAATKAFGEAAEPRADS